MPMRFKLLCVPTEDCSVLITVLACLRAGRQVSTPTPMESLSLKEETPAEHMLVPGWEVCPRHGSSEHLDAEPAVPERDEPWSRSDDRWDQLECKGFYARHARQPILYVIALLSALPAILVALPLALINAALHGPRRVFFLQERVGRRGRVYVIYKFRTMRDSTGCSDEARVTPFGRFLRNSHLDELPQLWNVLRGQMSLIGPRPEMTSIEGWAARRLPRFSERLVLRPGITGLAQITQGYAAHGDLAGYRRKEALNRTYRRSISLRGDLVILSRTGVWMLARRGWRWRDGLDS